MPGPRQARASLPLRAITVTGAQALSVGRYVPSPLYRASNEYVPAGGPCAKPVALTSPSTSVSACVAFASGLQVPFVYQRNVTVPVGVAPEPLTDAYGCTLVPSSTGSATARSAASRTSIWTVGTSAAETVTQALSAGS